MKRYSLYRFDDFAASIEAMSRFQKKKDALLAGFEYDSGGTAVASPAESQRIGKMLEKAAIECGLSAAGIDFARMHKIEMISHFCPTHRYKVGSVFDTTGIYGINHLLACRELPTLNTIFNGEKHKVGSHIYVLVDWAKAFDYTTDARTGLMKHVTNRNGKYYGDMCIVMDPMIDGVDSAAQALAWTAGKSESSPYLSKFGYVFGNNPIMVKSVISGKDGFVYVVFNADLTWYINGLGIVMETVKVALNRKEPGDYVICKYNE